MDRLDKVLSNKGYGSRKEVKKVIRKGFVKVNSETILKETFKVDINDLIQVYDEEFVYQEFVYIMLNKPQDIICSTFDENHMTVLDIIDDKTKGLFPVGRLDIDTEGFCLISNDGQLAHKLLTPKNKVPKTYEVHSENKLSNEDILKIESGMIIDDEKCLPAIIKEVNDYYELTIYEGKYHQIKRMFNKLNNKVVYLKRIKIGELNLDSTLELGEYRYLTEEEIILLTK